VFSSLVVHVCYFSVACYSSTFFTSLLHVSYFSTACYFSQFYPLF
jgi:hypothetical protein